MKVSSNENRGIEVATARHRAQQRPHIPRCLRSMRELRSEFFLHNCLSQVPAVCSALIQQGCWLRPGTRTACLLVHLRIMSKPGKTCRVAAPAGVALLSQKCADLTAGSHRPLVVVRASDAVPQLAAGAQLHEDVDVRGIFVRPLVARYVRVAAQPPQHLRAPRETQSRSCLLRRQRRDRLAEARSACAKG